MRGAASYDGYKKARNAAWQALLDNGICELPVDLCKIIKGHNITLKSYENAQIIFGILRLHDVALQTDGFTTIILGVPCIFYDNSKPIPRQRFTIAHELGHILLGHLTGSSVLCRCLSRWNGEQGEPSPLEAQANIFASRLLAPSCILHEIGASNAKDIAKIAGISLQAAQIRSQRLVTLGERDKYYQNKIELAVSAQFEDYIDRVRGEF